MSLGPWLARALHGGLLAAACIESGSWAAAQVPPPLDTVPVPRPANLGNFVRDEDVAIQLGKSLFWDQQLGSDGRTACASCHHHAGVDPRTVNTMAPGVNNRLQNVRVGGTVAQRNFPIQTDDVVGSQGVVANNFVGIAPGNAVDTGIPTPHPVFGSNPQVTGRQSPSVINAIFNTDSFWDGRARSAFNGRTPAGANTGATVLQVQSNGDVREVSVQLNLASAASQAVGPPDSNVEMAWAGRTLPDLGKKMLQLTPLGTQRVHAQDSVLGALRSASGVGLDVGYASLIEQAFQRSWWDSDAIVDRSGDVVGNGTPSGPDEFTLMEANFSLFFGLAIQLYEATLISDESPFDRFARGDTRALTAQQQLGLTTFRGRGGCQRCHGGSEFTNASVNVPGDARAFANIGIESLAEDPGNADGEFKTAQLRNTELTGPYFHNGKFATLRQVVAFYNNGGDVPNTELVRLNLTEAEKRALVAFLMSLTDERVRFQRAPFDHPSLNPVNSAPIPEVGAAGSSTALQTFLGLSPFTGFGSSAAIQVAGGGGGSSELHLRAAEHPGDGFRVLGSVGVEPAVPEAGSRLAARTSGAATFVVAEGRLDASGSAKVTLPEFAPARAFYRLLVTDPSSGEILTVSDSVSVTR